MPDFELFEHTADVGIRAHGSTLAELFGRMAQGLTALIAEDSALEPREERSIALDAQRVDDLLRRWLTELLYWFSTDHFLPYRFELDQVSETTLRGRVAGERFDASRHRYGTEVKGITRHCLRVAHQDDRWEADVIVDV